MRYLLTLGFVILLFLKGEGQYVLADTNSYSPYVYHHYELHQDNTFEYAYGSCYSGTGIGVGTYTKKWGNYVMKFDSLKIKGSSVVERHESGINGIKLQMNFVMLYDTSVWEFVEIDVIDSTGKIVGKYRTDSMGVVIIPNIGPNDIIKTVRNFNFKPNLINNTYIVYLQAYSQKNAIKAGTLHKLIKRRKNLYIRPLPSYLIKRYRDLPKKERSFKFYLSKGTVKK